MPEQLKTLFAAVVFLCASSTAPGQPQDQNRGSYLHDRTPWGDPNIQGVWDRRTITPLERPERLADKAFLSAAEIRDYERASAAREDGRPLDSARSGISVHDPRDLDYGTRVLPTGQTALIVDPPSGRIPPLTESASTRVIAQRQARAGRGPADDWTDRSLNERCISWGMPGSMLPQAYNNNIQVLQTPDHVAIYVEMVHDVRIIPLDRRPPLPERVRQWHGDARGRWEGDTLVVETTNFSAKSSFRRSTARLHLEERFTRSADDMLQYEFTVTDPDTWEQPWTVSFPMLRGTQPLYEFACHEGNYGLLNILKVARNLERMASQ